MEEWEWECVQYRAEEGKLVSISKGCNLIPPTVYHLNRQAFINAKHQ